MIYARICFSETFLIIYRDNLRIANGTRFAYCLIAGGRRWQSGRGMHINLSWLFILNIGLDCPIGLWSVQGEHSHWPT